MWSSGMGFKKPKPNQTFLFGFLNPRLVLLVGFGPKLTNNKNLKL